ncbi:response regulator transcription factor [Novosphingobium album (ex Liu et al. 2023)]|uniref:Response regulator n=1 Tax=Novosphingobium album (ex Liu et al. 2023) TaxID=3031130 RepID=A0ABT5WKP9_9SPHN|nr:response regulator [Novosphingobium album (ex Liu et al. 2023)]MDE8650616.1 response regulator [Novosphingobium album (ex Liu et al. 2023)]
MDDKRVVHIVDDEDSVRRSIGFMLKKSGYMVVPWVSGVEFLKNIKNAAHGCILLDIRMPEMDGLQVQQELNGRGVAMPVVLLTGHGDVANAVCAMKAGAVDFIEKPFEKAILLTAIESAFERIADTEARANRAADAAILIAGLSAREQDVLKGLAQGLPNKAIAYDLGISPRTVEVHRANVMTKLSVRSLSEALRIAFAAGVTG